MIFTVRIFILAGFLSIWEYASANQMIDVFFFSSPSIILKTFVNMILENQLLTHIKATLFETILSFLLVNIISIFTASILWFSANTAKICEPYLILLNSLPKSALAPLLIVWLGTGTRTIIVAGISVALFGAIISIYTGFLQTDPGSVPILISTMKINIGLCLVGVIIGEFLAARQGLGYLIIYGSQVFQLHLVILSILILCIIPILFYELLQLLEKRVN
ncbi:MAG: ABC transporter permease [Lachnospiraceae bacterium]|nr:ABC transporter permease [Lachnospiraceae bacterium]